MSTRPTGQDAATEAIGLARASLGADAGSMPSPSRDGGSSARQLLTTSEGGKLISGSAWVMAGFISQAATGAIFWLLAARYYSSDTVGLAAALFATLQAVNYLTAMGLQETLARYQAGSSGRSDPVFTWSVLTTTITSVIGVGLLVAFVDTESLDTFRSVFGAFAPILLFSISALSAIALLADVRWLGADGWRVVALRLFLTGVLRLPLLFVVGGTDAAVWLFLTMAVPIAVSGLISGVILPRSTSHPLSLKRPHQPVGDIIRYSSVNYVGHLALQAPQFLLPVIVLLSVGPTENANFFLAWTVVSVVAVLPVTISRMLVVQVSREGADVEAHTRLALAYSMIVVFIALLMALVFRGLAESLLGDSYSTIAEVLPPMTAAGFPWAFTVVVLGYLRARHDHLGTVVLTSALAVAIIGIAVARVPVSGIDGAVQAWVVGNVVTALLAIPVGARARRLPIGREELGAIDRDGAQSQSS